MLRLEVKDDMAKACLILLQRDPEELKVKEAEEVDGVTEKEVR